MMRSMSVKKRTLSVMLALIVTLSVVAVPVSAGQVESADLGAAHGGWDETGDEVVTGAAFAVGAAGCVASGGALCGAAAAAGYLATQATDNDQNDGLDVSS